jgi:hypothetical protein
MFFDFEGTLSISRWREAYKPNWDAYQSLLYLDPPNRTICQIARKAVSDPNIDVYILTSVHEKQRSKMARWLGDCGIYYQHLEMRKEHGPSCVDIKIKYMWNFDPEDIIMFFDDREDVCNSLEIIGFKTFKVSNKL